jgi:cytoskeleton protein RodZ
MQTLGQRLRAEREKKGLSIAELAGRTRIRADYFQAIENDRPELFPGQFFYRSFLRQYAELLELPSDLIQHEIQRSIEAEQADSSARTLANVESKPDVPPLPTGRTDVRLEAQRWLIRLSALAGVILLCSGTYYVWLLWGQHWLDQTMKPTAGQHAAAAKPNRAGPAIPASRPQAQGQTPAQTPGQNPAAGANPGQAQNTAQGTTQPAAVSAPVQAPPQPAPPLPAASAAPPAASRPSAEPTGPALVELAAQDACWVDLWRDGKHTIGEMLRAGDHRSIASGGKLRIRLGSAGAVQVRAGGRDLGRLGPLGQTRTLECDNVQCALATPKPPGDAAKSQSDTQNR